MTGTLTKTVLDTSRQTEPYPMNGQGNGLSSTTASPIIEFDAVTKKFGEHVVLDQLSFNVQQGEKVTIIGPSGSGKIGRASCRERVESTVVGSTVQQKNIKKSDVANVAMNG